MPTVDVYVAPHLSLSDLVLEGSAGPLTWEGLFGFCLRKSCPADLEFDRDAVVRRLAGHRVPLAPGFMYPHTNLPTLEDRFVVGACRFECPVRWPEAEDGRPEDPDDPFGVGRPLKFVVLLLAPEHWPDYTRVLQCIGRMGKSLRDDWGAGMSDQAYLERFHAVSSREFIRSVQVGFEDHPSATIVVHDP
jgi:hypothetical protein